MATVAVMLLFRRFRIDGVLAAGIVGMHPDAGAGKSTAVANIDRQRYAAAADRYYRLMLSRM